jgi:hypothetical protein
MIGNAAHESGADTVFERRPEALSNIDFPSPHDCLEKPKLCGIFVEITSVKCEMVWFI